MEKTFCSRWLSGGIGEDFKNWLQKKDMGSPLSSAARVYIESPTGTGKTSFVLNELLPYAVEHGRAILYLGNRTALKEQIQNAIKQKLIEITNGSVSHSTIEELFI